MATKLDSLELLNAEDIRKCSICRRDAVDPKTLPCLHSFCLGCIRQYCERLSGTPLTCSVCDDEFKLPEGGVDQLPVNLFLETLMRVGKNAPSGVLCEKCSQPIE